MKQKIAIMILFTVLILSACKTIKIIPKTTQSASNPVAKVIDLVQKAQPQFNTANVSKMSVAIDLKERKFNVNATCKIKKDSAIYLSIQPFMGIELFKAEITTDSIRVYDKMNRRFYVTDYGYFNNRFGVNVDFNSLQALLSAQFFNVGKKAIQPDSCKLTTLPTGQNKIEFVNNNMVQSTDISALNLIEVVLLKGKNSNYQMQTNYTEYTKVNGVNFPQKISLQVSSQDMHASCEFSILRVEFNSNLIFSPTSPDKFTRGDLDQLLKK
jgi:hypothetical protein